MEATPQALAVGLLITAAVFFCYIPLLLLSDWIDYHFNDGSRDSMHGWAMGFIMSCGCFPTLLLGIPLLYTGILCFTGPLNGNGMDILISASVCSSLLLVFTAFFICLACTEELRGFGIAMIGVGIVGLSFSLSTTVWAYNKWALVGSLE